MKRKRVLTVSLVVIMALMCVFTGCEKKEETATKADFEFSGYPIKSDTELTYFMAVNTNLTSVCENFGDTDIAKELAAKTGVKVKYIHPAAGQENQSVALYIASNEMPDMVEYNWLTYSSGVSKAISENAIIELNDLIDDSAPNLKKYLSETPDIDKRIKTDEGQYYVFPFIRGDEKLLVSTGPIIRKDWIDELGLKLPETLEDMENILTAFKEKKGAVAPLSVPGVANNVVMAGGFQNFYVKDGKTVYGVLEDSYKEALMTLNRWFEKGLLDKNFVSLDQQILDANMLNGHTGVTFSAGGSGLGKWIESMEGKDSTYNLTGFALPYAFLTGNIVDPYIGQGSVAISAGCKSPALAARFLDYGYSEEGKMLYNFGIEGKSYSMESGEPLYTDEIMKNSEGLTMAQAMSKYIRASNVGPFVQDVRYIDQYYKRPQQQEALVAWSSKMDEERKLTYPVATLTAEENEEFSTIMTEVKTYVNEMSTQFILGTRSFDTYDDFIKDLKKLNIEKAIQIKEAARQRYESR